MIKRIKFTVLLIFTLVVCLGLTSCLESFYTNIKDKFNTNEDEDQDERNNEDDEPDGENENNNNEPGDDDETKGDPDKPDDGDTDPVEPETPGSTEITITSISITEEGFLLGYTSEELPSSENFSGTVAFNATYLEDSHITYECEDLDIIIDEYTINVKIGDFDGLDSDELTNWEYVKGSLPKIVVEVLNGTSKLEFKLTDVFNDKEYIFTYTFNSSISSWERTGI